MPAVGAAAKEVQLKPSFAGDVASGASEKDTSESETKDKAGIGKIEEQGDLFVSGVYRW